MKMSEVIACVRNHFVALRTNDSLTGGKAGSKQLTFARNVKRGRKDEGSILRSQDCSDIKIPPFPKDLEKVVSDSVLERLLRWRKFCNKKKKNEWESKLIMGSEYTLYRDKERPSKPPNKIKSRKRDDDDDGDDDSRDRKRRRSSKSKRYADERKKIRRSKKKDSDSSVSSYSNDSAVGVISSDEDFTPKKKKKKSAHKRKHEDDNDRNKKFRRTTNNPVGILVRKRSGAS